MTKSHRQNHTQKLSLRLVVFAMLANCPWAFASDFQIDPTLEKLEQKFFSQTYKSDTDDKRVGRLEEMLFGHTVSGPVEQRFASIELALNSIKKDSAVSQDDSRVDDFGSDSGLKTNGSGKGKPVVGKAPAAGSKGYEPLDASGYQPQTADDPNALVGISPEQAARVRRRKAALMGAKNSYGGDGQMSAQGEGPDESLIDPRQVGNQGARKHSDWDDSEGMNGADSMADADDSDQDMISIGMGLGISMGGMGSNMGMGGSSNFFGQRSGSTPPKYAPAKQQQPRTTELNMTEKLSVMEKKVFGKANPRQSLLERVKRLEKDVLPTEKDAAQEALPDRVAKLWEAVGSKPVQTGGIQYPTTADQPTGNADSYSTSQPYSANSTMSLGSSGSGYPQNMDANKPGVLHKIGQAIGQAASGMMSGNTSYGYPGYGYGGMSPYGLSPYGLSPYGMSPYGISPYGMSPYGMSPYGISPYGMSPYGGLGGLGGSYRNLPFVGGGGMSPFGGYGGINPYGYGSGISPFGVSPLGNQMLSPATPLPRQGGLYRFF